MEPPTEETAPWRTTRAEANYACVTAEAVAETSFITDLMNMATVEGCIGPMADIGQGSPLAPSDGGALGAKSLQIAGGPLGHAYISVVPPPSLALESRSPLTP